MKKLTLIFFIFFQYLNLMISQNLDVKKEMFLNKQKVSKINSIFIPMVGKIEIKSTKGKMDKNLIAFSTSEKMVNNYCYETKELLDNKRNCLDKLLEKK